LAPGYRLVLILHDVEGYEHEEIGKMLGVAVGTTKSQLHKARMKLRELLTHGQKALAKPRKTRPRLTSRLKLKVHTGIPQKRLA